MEISVCLIVKNEEDVIARCLDCVKKFADEIIVVDTGSNDNTIDIVNKYTDNVYNYKWIDDFSAARNYSFSKATKDYVMWIDADDTILDTEIEKINNLKPNMCADTYMLKYAISFDGEGNAIFSYFRERILKRSNEPKWEGFIHEAIVPFGKIEYLDITIEHHKLSSTNTRRNLDIYEKHINNGHNLSTRSQYYYSKELYYNSMYRKCIRELKKYFKMNNKFSSNLTDAYLTIARCYRVLGKNKIALDYLFGSLHDVDPTSEILCEIGSIFADNNNYNRAILFYESAILIEPDYMSGMFINKNYYYLYPYIELTVLYYRVGNFEKSKKYHLLAKTFSPNHPSVLYNDQFFTY